MREIDERIVEMRFRNSNFEKNAKSTISVLDKLEQKLAFPNAKKNIEGLEKEFSKISFGALEKGIETVTLKFSALQIAGITALQNITNKAINAGEDLVKSLSLDQIISGFTKYEQKTTAVQTIMSATGKTVEEVNTSLKKLNWFTDETSYNFTDMVENIGKFTSAGVDLEDAMSAMIGIANEAAVSGQNAQAASRAMYNFAQAIGVGAVKLMDWKSIENANMATQEFKQTIIDTAVNMGTLEKVAEGTYKVVGSKDAMVSVNNFNEELKEGWFTSDVLINSLKQYSGYAEEIYELQQKMGLDTAAEAMAIYSNEIETLGEKAFKAGQVSKTLTDAIDATKDAVSTQWMNMFEMIVGNLDQASALWTEFTNYLWDFFASDLVNMNDFLEPILATDPYDNLIAELKELGITEDQFGEIVVKNAKKHGAAIDDIIEREGSLAAAIRKNGFGPIIRESIDELAEGAEVTSTKVVDLTDKMEEYNKVVMDVIRGNYKNGIEARTKALAEAGYEFSVIQPLVNKWYEKGSLSIEDYQEVLGELTEEELKNIGITKEQAESLKELSDGLTKKSGRELIIDSFRNALNGVQKVILTVKDAWNEIFPPKTQEEVYGIIEKFHDFSKNLILNEENADKLKRSLKGVFAALDIVKQIIGGAFKTSLSVLSKLFGKTGLDIGEMSASLGDSIVALRNWLNEGNKIGVFFESLTYSILHAKEYIQGWLDSFMEAHPNFSKWFDGLKSAFEQFKLSTKNMWGSIVEDIKSGKIKDALRTVAGYFLEFRDTVISYLTGIDFNSYVDTTKENGFKRAQTVLDGIKSTFLGIFDAIKNAAITIWGWIKTFVGNLNPLWFIPVMFTVIVVSIRQVSKEISVLLKYLKPLDDVKKAFINMLTTIGKSVSRYMDAKKWSERGKAVLYFASGIALLAASVVALSQVSWGKLIGASVIITVFIAALATAEIFMTQLGSQGKAISKMGSFAAGLAAAFILSAAAFKILETIDINKMAYVVEMFVATLLTLGLAILGFSFMKELPQVKGTLITLGVVIGMISASFVALNFVKTEGLAGKIAGIVVVLGALVGVMTLLSLIQKKWDGIAKATSLIGIIVALDLLVVSLKLIETVKVKEILKHLGSFISVFVMLRVLAGIASKINGGSGGWQILALATGLLLLVPAINSFSKIDGKALGKAIIAVGALLLLERLIVGASEFAGQNAAKAGAMILMISVAVSALSLIVWGFTYLDQGKLWSGVAAMDTILLMMAILVMASEKAEGGVQRIVWLTVFASLMSVAIGVLAKMDTDRVLQSAGAISLLLLSLTASLKLLDNVEGLEGKVIKNLFALSGVMVVLASILTLFAEINPEGAVLQATAIGALLLALSGATAILMKFGDVQNDMKNAWISLGIMTGAIAIIASVLYMIQDLDPERMLAQVGALSVAMASLLAATTLIVLISKIPGIENVNSGLIAVGKVVGIMAGILLVIGGLEATIKELGGSWTLTDLLNEATLVMTALGNAIGSLIGGIFGGIAGGIGEAFTSHLDLIGGNLEVFATHLSTFSSNLEPFITQMTSMKGANELASMTGIIDAISKLTESAFTSSVSDFISWFTGDKNAFDKLGNGLISFASALTVVGNIAYQMSGTGTLSSLEDFSEITATLTELLKEVPTQNDFSEWFNGKITFATLGTGLLSYGTALKNFGDSVKDLDTESIDNSVTPTKTLTELLRDIPTDGGMWGAFFDGTLSWDNLSTGLKDLGQALVDYGLKCYASRNLFTHIINSKDAITALSEMQESIPKIGGVLGCFTGDHDWSTLSTGLNNLGDGLISFGNKAKELKDSENLSVVQATVPLLDKFVSTVNEFTNITGLGLINDVAINAATILGSMVNAFGENVGATDIQNRVKKGLAAANDMYDFAKTVSSSYLMGTEMTTLGKDINGYAKEMAAAAKTLRSIDNEDFYELAKYVISGYSNGLYTGQAVVKESVAKAMVDTTLNTLENGLEIHSPSWKTFADGLFTAEGFGGGLEKGKEYIKDAVSGWGQEVLSGIDLNSILDRFSEFGVDLTKVIPDISSLGIDLGTDLTFDYEKRIADMKTNISELTKELGNNSDEVINAQLELDKLQDEYQDYTKSRTSNLEYYENKEYEEAQKQFDKLLEDYKAGRKTQMEFDTEYTQLLQKNTVKQAELFQYSAQKIQEYVSDSLGKVQDEFETTISGIQSKMDSTIDNWNKTFDDEFKFTTRQDLFDEEISKYDKELEQLNKRIEEQKKLRGENSLVVQHMQKDYERLQKTRDEINEQWEEQDENYKKEIVSVDMTGEWDKQAERATKSLEAVDSLKGRLSQDMIDWLGTLDPDTLYAVATDWASKSDSELQVITNKYLNMIEANKALANSLYAPEIQEAERKFVYDFNQTLYELPDTAKTIGISVVANMTNSFSDETNKTLQTFKESGDVLIFALKEGLGLTDENSKPKNIGEDVSNDIGTGFANNQEQLVEVFSDTLGNSLYEATNNIDYDGIAKSLGHGLYEALDNIDADSSISINPVSSITADNALSNKRSLNSGRSISIARDTGSAFNRRYDIAEDNKVETTELVHKAMSFVQNIYSPDPISRSEIRRDTKQMFQLANSKFK